MKLKIGKFTTLDGLPCGSLFLSKDKTCLGLKTEYRTEQGAILAYIVGSGEFFWGGTSNIQEQLMIEVWEVKIKDKENILSL